MTFQHPHLFGRTDRTRMGTWWWTTDHLLLGAAALLITIGVLLSFASSPAAAIRTHYSDPFHYAVRQCVFGGLGAALLVGASMLSPRGVRRASFFIFIGAMLLMVGLMFFGHSAKGATRWIQLPGFSLQPSEFMKPAFVVMIAWMFAEGQKDDGVPGVSIAFGLYAAAAALLLLQPDVGQTILITVAFGACFFIAGVPFKWVAALIAMAMAGMVALYLFVGHVTERVNTFLFPESSDAHQITRAAEAIATGGLFGRGPGEGVMKRHVPDLHTDFIYSVAAEEYGLLFSLGLILLFGVLVVRGLQKSMKLSDPFEQIAAGGLFVLVGQQALINMAVNLNLIPTKGMTLPFISYGGSSMLAMGLTVGLALALTRKRPGAYEPGDGLAIAGVCV